MDGLGTEGVFKQASPDEQAFTDLRLSAVIWYHMMTIAPPGASFISRFSNSR